MIILHDVIRPYLSALSFAEIMSLQGEVFRQQPGRCTQRIELGGEKYFIKQHFGVGWKEILKNLLQLRLPIISAYNERQALQRLAELHVKVPEVVGYGISGQNPASKKSFLITHELPPHISLEDFCRTWPEQPPLFTVKQKIINKVASIAKTMHESGINHRDFYICHFLLDSTIGIQDEITLYLIDLHRAQMRNKVPLRWQIKDLAGLYFSSKAIGLTQRDLLRFMKQYRNKDLREIFNKELNFWLQVKKRGDKLHRKYGK